MFSVIFGHQPPWDHFSQHTHCSLFVPIFYSELLYAITHTPHALARRLTLHKLLRTQYGLFPLVQYIARAWSGAERRIGIRKMAAKFRQAALFGASRRHIMLGLSEWFCSSFARIFSGTDTGLNFFSGLMLLFKSTISRSAIGPRTQPKLASVPEQNTSNTQAKWRVEPLETPSCTQAVPKQQSCQHVPVIPVTIPAQYGTESAAVLVDTMLAPRFAHLDPLAPQ